MDDRSEIRDITESFILQKMNEGFDSDTQIREWAFEKAADEAFENDIDLSDDTLKKIADQAYAAAAKSRHADMATWPMVTDCDRLDAAFTELNAMGIMARHNWTCCSTCGNSQMSDEFRRLNGKIGKAPIIGYVFYHQQDTERAAEGSGLYLGFGSTLKPNSEAEFRERSVAIARTACDVLAKHRLKTIWDGRFNQRPNVALSWKRRGVPKDYIANDGPGHGAPQQNQPAPTPTRVQRPIEKLASYAITSMAVVAAIAVVIPVALIGVPIGNWMLHSVWLAVILGAATLLVVGAVLTGIAKLLGLNVTPFGHDAPERKV